MTFTTEEILAATKRAFGFDSLRAWQQQAIELALAGRDSLVVLPTGGGKSLCYQVPPLLSGALTVVVSPLIALMKDQVDGLVTDGYPAAALHSNLGAREQHEVEETLRAGTLRLLYVAPERLLTDRMLALLRAREVRSFAIDEAHCISHWGHDFRPEYRRLAELRTHFPQASVHAFTATATERVRADIVAELRLRDPQVIVGVFDRPNLAYRVVPRTDLDEQLQEILRRHAGKAAIVYALSRADTERIAARLARSGMRCDAYHAGLPAEQRRRVQEAFLQERLDVVVATVAFGMGIDRSDVRCVVHAALPRSVEHYQQETGRAGRDGLPAECVLLFSGADAMRWRILIERSAAEMQSDPGVAEAQKDLVTRMHRFASALTCRHRALSEHFGQRYEQESCGACDVCLDETETIDDGQRIAQMILSCVARVQQRFGLSHVIDVLRGSQGEKVTQRGHDRLSTFGLLKEHRKDELVGYAQQLLDAGLLAQTEGEYPVLVLNEASWTVLRGGREVTLRRARRVASAKKRQAERAAAAQWDGVDQGLFEDLRRLRRELAARDAVPAYIVCGDRTLADLARVRPSDEAGLLTVHGIGPAKVERYGKELLARLAAWVERGGATAM